MCLTMCYHVFDHAFDHVFGHVESLKQDMCSTLGLFLVLPLTYYPPTTTTTTHPQPCIPL